MCSHIVMYLAVIAGVNLNNLKANHNPLGEWCSSRAAVIAGVI